MNKIKTLTLILLSVIGFAAFGQVDVSIGNWRSHLPYQKVIDVETFGNKVFAATPYELFFYDKDDNSINILNKINGLSDVGISTIRYNKKMNLLFVGYTDANVDLVYSDGEIRNMSDIKDKNLLGSKTINNVFFDEEFAYVACGFGIVVFDMKRCEVKDTYYIGSQGSMVNVRDIAFYNGRIYASTDDGLYSASLDAQSLANFASWRFERDLIHPHLAYDELEAFNGKLFLNYNGGFNSDTLFVFNGNTWDYFEKEASHVRQELRAYDDCFLITTQYNVFVYNSQFQQIVNVYSPGDRIEPLSAAKDAHGDFWIGDAKRGMVKTTDGWNNMDVLPNGPYTKSAYQLQACGNQVWVATGGHASNWAPRYMKEGVFRFDGSWTSFNRTTLPAIDSYCDFICTATNPNDPSVTYVGTWGYGILKFKNGQLDGVFNADNSTLDYWTSDPSLILISGLAFDSKGNLWVANSGANNMLSVMEPNGNWHSFNLGGTYSGVDISSLYIDTHDIKWILRRVGQESQVIVFDDNGTLDITSDDNVKGLTKNVGDLPGNMVNCIAVDKSNGVVWLGTDVGPCRFDDSRRLFSEPNYKASRPMVRRNDGTDQVDPLFDGSNVLSMAVDGGGNKWFGLETGVYVVDDSQVNVTLKHNFTTSNSPLLDNAVRTMAVSADGEVFFGTDSGIISYKGEASDPDPTPSEIIAYPNPVRPGYEGYVGIKGLAADALVRITTVDGGFVTELQAEGGQAVWDCTASDGRKVTPGVYLIFVSTDDGQHRFATKILVMN